MPTTNIRWGILGAGNIAKKFAEGLKQLPEATLQAVGSRDLAKAQAFASAFGPAKAYGSYHALVSDAEVDAIYVATPHPFHMEHSMLCLAHGKAVLCEKPFAINAGEAREMIKLSRHKNVFLMEAMWTRFLPYIVKLRELLKENAIGEVRMIQADFGFRAGVDPKGRLFDLALGGGGLLDVGVYPISLASMILGKPTQTASLAHLGETGVDEQNACVLGYDKGRLALVSSAVRTNTPHEAFILGTEGKIKLHAPWWAGKVLTLYRDGKKEETIEVGFEGNGYQFEAAEVARCLAAGKIESDIMPHHETVAIMETLDELRAQWGMKYPMEE